MEISRTSTSFVGNSFKGTLQPLTGESNIQPETSEATGYVAGADTVNVSQDALLLTEALNVARSTPDVRAEKVEALRAKIANGSYEINTRKIASALIAEEPGLFRA